METVFRLYKLFDASPFKRATFAAALSLVSLVPGNALATPLLAGQTISYTYFFPNITTTYSAPGDGNYVVGPGGVDIINGSENLYVTDHNLFLSFTSSSSITAASFNGFRISDVNDTIGAFTSVSLNSVTNLTGFTNADITFDANNIYVNLEGLDFTPSSSVSIDIGGATTVPEPSSLSLLLAGLLSIVGIGAYRRCKVMV